MKWLSKGKCILCFYLYGYTVSLYEIIVLTYTECCYCRLFKWKELKELNADNSFLLVFFISLSSDHMLYISHHSVMQRYNIISSEWEKDCQDLLQPWADPTWHSSQYGNNFVFLCLYIYIKYTVNHCQIPCLALAETVNASYEELMVETRVKLENSTWRL